MTVIFSIVENEYFRLIFDALVKTALLSLPVFVLPKIFSFFHKKYIEKKEAEICNFETSCKIKTAKELAEAMFYGNFVKRIKKQKGGSAYSFTNTEVIIGSDFKEGTIAMVAIVAHEMGHFAEHKKPNNEKLYLDIAHRGYATLAGSLCKFLIPWGLFFHFVRDNSFCPQFVLSLVLLLYAIFGSVFALPNEREASRNALKITTAGEFVDAEELPKIEKVLAFYLNTYYLYFLRLIAECVLLSIYFCILYNIYM